MPGFVAAVQPSVIVPIGLTHQYYMCFLAGFAISSAVFCLLHAVFPAHEVREFVARSPPPRFVMADCQDRWDGETSEDVESDVNKVGNVTNRELQF